MFLFDSYNFIIFSKNFFMIFIFYEDKEVIFLFYYYFQLQLPFVLFEKEKKTYWKCDIYNLTYV